MKTIESVLFAALLLGCGADHTSDPAENIAPDFGATYGISVGANKAPRMEGPSLIVTVNYSGCSRNHAFVLRGRTRSDSLQFWLYKATPDEDCEMAVEEQRTFRLPLTLTSRMTVALLAPGGTRHLLQKRTSPLGPSSNELRATVKEQESSARL